MTAPTVAEYVLARLSRLGIDRVFGVPGDYAFSIDDAVEKVPGLSWVGCVNELNAAYAADGYARIRGAAILATTYGVGELSALNGVMGSRAHRLPVFHLVGMPSERIRRLGLPTHHNLGDTVYDRFQAISGAACCVTAVLTPDNCVDELERAIRESLRKSMPAYVVISQASGVAPVIGTPVEGTPLADVTRQRSDPGELDAAVSALAALIDGAKRPAALVTSLVARYGLRDAAAEVLSRAGLPFALTPDDKGTLDEGLPGHLGIYAGARSSSAAVREAIETADLLLDVGGVILTEINTGFWSHAIDPARVAAIHDDWVRVGDRVWINVAIGDVLRGLAERVRPRTMPSGPAKAAPALAGCGADPTTSAAFYPRLARRLKAGDTLVIETGTCMVHATTLDLPPGVGYEAQGLWGSIGWATPACLGIVLAKSTGRTWLVTGDGSHQMTLNELATMGRSRVRPVIMVLNNGLYGIEDVISERGHGYDDLAAVEYHLLPAAFGCGGWLSARVRTVAELEAALDAAERHEGAVYLEVMIPNEESQPFPEELVDRGYKVRTPGRR